MGHCICPLDFLVQRKAKPTPGLDAFWIFPPERSFTGIYTGMEGEKNNQRVQILLYLRRVWCLTHWIAQTSQLWPRCCGCLVTLDTTFWKREEIPPNPLIYVLKPLLEKKQLTPFSSLRAETGRRVGAKAAERKTFPRHFGTELVKNGEKIGLQNARFHPKLNGDPQDSPGWKETQYCCLKDDFSLVLSLHMGKWWSFSPMGEGNCQKPCILGFFILNASKRVYFALKCGMGGNAKANQGKNKGIVFCRFLL